jgi:hypothetical protein
VDGSGNLYIAEVHSHRVRRVDAVTGIITTVAGTGESGFSGDGGPATQARLWLPHGVLVDAAGHLFIGDSVNSRVRRVDAITGTITTVAGRGGRGFDGDGGPAIQARLGRPRGLHVDDAGHLYIVDSYSCTVRRVDATTGIITTVVGTGDCSASGDGGPAMEAELFGPEDIFVDRKGDLYIADTEGHRIRRVDAATGIITPVAGTGEGAGVIVGKRAGRKQDDFSVAGFSGDGGPATEARLHNPTGVAVDAVGNLFISDKWNNRIRRVDAVTGTIATVAGTGEDGFSGDGGAPTLAQLYAPGAVALDGSGQLYIADTGNGRIRRMTVVPTVVTDGAKSEQTAVAYSLDQNYPNPFNPSTIIRYQLAEAGPVSVTLYNLLGQRIRTLVQGSQPTGSYRLTWDGRDASGREVAAGVYVYRLASPQGTLARSMVLLK